MGELLSVLFPLLWLAFSWLGALTFSSMLGPFSAGEDLVEMLQLSTFKIPRQPQPRLTRLWRGILKLLVDLERSFILNFKTRKNMLQKGNNASQHTTLLLHYYLTLHYYPIVFCFSKDSASTDHGIDQ